ncbi:enoyl-CoA hydratase/isomerase family protein [Sphingobium sp. B11D3D]|uniref:enoyl-CoA hydratase/isomerase family protein n=1 Tax=Sphingobium sp. B11D3D TaxID=2940576 RepID=UPI002224A332|nr:enoyl-CoA hydratase/isomerase family protein [Sphingobium sp. B11D3D]MCW2370077.1 enoyl-CoA hydratase/carnithine racemase [Sphingobium sp. B11D3D]
MLESTKQDGITRLTLANDQRRNALAPELVRALSAALETAFHDGSRLIVLDGRGKAFCAGFDLSDLEEASHGDLLLRLVEIEQLLQLVYHAPTPVIALGHGPCFGAGADLFAACAHRIAAPDARFMFPGPRFGLVLGTRRLAARVGDDAAWRIVSTTEKLDATAALSLGIATEIAPVEDWPARVESIAASLEPIEPLTHGRLLAVTKRDHRDADLADLVRSAAVPDFKQKLQSYVAGR